MKFKMLLVIHVVHMIYFKCLGMFNCYLSGEYAMCRRKRIGILLFMLMLLLIAVPVSAKPAKSTVKKAYQTYRIKKGINQYKLVNIDKNGILDMIYCKDERMGVCSYKASKKKVVLVKRAPMTGKAPLTVYYNKSKHYFGWCQGDTGGGKYTIYKMEGTKAKSTISIKWANGKFEPAYQKLNGKNISDTQLNKEIQKIWKYRSVTFKYGL